MDKVWNESPSKLEVIGVCGSDVKKNDLAVPTKSIAKKQPENYYIYFGLTWRIHSIFS